MIDHYLGQVLDALDETNAWDDTAVVLCTDHGHYLGDSDVHGRDLWGKPSVPVYKELGNIPMMIYWPGVTPRVCNALTTSTDIHATIAEVFDAEVKHRTHGTSLQPLIDASSERIRDWLLTGVWGREVQLVTEEWRYSRGPTGANAPLSLWANRWSTMPIAKYPNYKMPNPDERAKLEADPGLIGNTVQEIIRWQTPLAHMRRTATQDTELMGQMIAEGDKLVLWYLSANRDESVFERPDEIIVDRANARRHLAFGHGIHRCVGARLAELQIGVLMEEMAKRRLRPNVIAEPERVSACFVHGYKAMPVELSRY